MEKNKGEDKRGEEAAVKKQQRRQQPPQNGPKKTAKQPTSSNNNRNSLNNYNKRSIFKPYYNLEKLQNGLKRKELIQGAIRINPRNYEECYLDNPDGDTDILIFGMNDRNRALHGDIVAVKIKSRDNWRVLDDAPALNSTNKKSNEKEKKTSPIENQHSSSDSALEIVNESDEETADVIVIDDGANESNALAEESQNDVERVQDSNSLNSSPDTPTALTKQKNSQQQTPNRSKETTTPQKNKRNEIKAVADFPDRFIPDEYLQKTAEVVYIVERKHTRVGVGCLRMMQEPNSDWALFAPNDSRMPRMIVPMKECPPTFMQRPQDFQKMLFIARLVEWNEYSRFAKGALCKSLGMAGEIEPETEGMLAQYGVDKEDFSEDVISCLPHIPAGSMWTIPTEELNSRKDFRNELLFSIDPATARDLDDALHVKLLDNGFYEVGVHIADVSFFVRPGNALDAVAKSRATSVYLVHEVIPMLPRLLCEELCSLNAGVDRLSFSVVWKMNAKGVIYDEWFGRSIIRSCCKLTYDHAQGFIQEPERVWSLDELPPISNGKTADEIAKAVQILNQMAVAMRQRRHDSGALRLDQPKLSFSLNKETGLPNGCAIYELKDSNRLIEEFMLLANMAVAHRIFKFFSETAVLRRHPPPKFKVLLETQLICKQFGFELDGSTSTTLQTSLRRHYGHSEKAQAVWAVLMQLVSRPMQLAQYFCTGALDDDCLYHHYALNVPLYTHFTSPIRRYPDIMVHRLLAATLEYAEPPNLPVKELEQICKHCNDKKVNAKSVSDASGEMFFSIFVNECGPIEEKGIVMGVMDHSVDVLIIRYGIGRRVYCNRLKDLTHFTYDIGDNDQNGTGKMTLSWSSGVRQTVQMFELVDLILLKNDEEPLKFITLIKPQSER